MEVDGPHPDSGETASLLRASDTDTAEHMENDHPAGPEGNNDDVALNLDEDEDPQDAIPSPRVITLRPTRWLFGVHFAAMVILTTIVVSLDRGAECDQPLLMWLVVWVCAQGLHVSCSLWSTVVSKISGYDALADDFSDGMPHHAARAQMRVAAGLQRLLNTFWLFWFVIGAVWTFRARTCSQTSHLLYTVCLVLVIVHLCTGGLVVLCCCCCFVCLGALYVYNPNIFTPAQAQSVQGATKATIDALETKKYTPGMFEEEDAKCAICLEDYNEDDDVRFLPCTPIKHHFHNECVDSWLAINKSCPFCKHDIDAAPESESSEQTPPV